uniref:Uncharacterized protein n=1 Tax=Meloidogyne hapla TaxID=6305 RepID=A0A1I8AXP2_MELHA
MSVGFRYFIYAFIGLGIASIRLHGPLLDRVLHVPISFFNKFGKTSHYDNEFFKIIDIESGDFKFNVSDQLLEKHIETSTNCSNIINYVLFNGCQWTHFNLSERAKNIERKTYGPNDCIKYQIVNIYDPKIKFLIICWQSITGTIVQFEIKRISG